MTKKVALVGPNPTVGVTCSSCYELTGRKLNFDTGKHWNDILRLLRRSSSSSKIEGQVIIIIIIIMFLKG